MDEMQIVAAADDDGWNQHGYPQGYHFVPDDLELIRLLEDRLAHRRLPFPLANIFHNVKIRDFHPAELFEAYKGHQENGAIYFFNRREFQSPTSTKRPMRSTKVGNWKASGGGKELRRGGLAVGYRLTMVFYVKKPGLKDGQKTLWAVNEYTRIVGPGKKVADMALYRLHRKKQTEKEKEKEKETSARRSSKSNTPTSARAKEEEEEAPAPPLPPQHPYFACPSTSQAHAYHQHAFSAPVEPSTSGWVRPATGLMEIAGPPAATGYHHHQQQHMTVQYITGIAEWDQRLPALGSPATAAVASQHFGYQQTNGQNFVYHQETNRQQMQTFPPPPLSASQHFGYQETAGSLKNISPSPSMLPVPGAEGYRTDEFDVWCKRQQQEEDAQQVAGGWLPPMPDDINITQDDINISGVLTDASPVNFDIGDISDSDFSCTFEEFEAIMNSPASPPQPC